MGQVDGLTAGKPGRKTAGNRGAPLRAHWRHTRFGAVLSPRWPPRQEGCGERLSVGASRKAKAGATGVADRRGPCGGWGRRWRRRLLRRRREDRCCAGTRKAARNTGLETRATKGGYGGRRQETALRIEGRTACATNGDRAVLAAERELCGVGRSFRTTGRGWAQDRARARSRAGRAEAAPYAGKRRVWQTSRYRGLK